MTILDEAGKLVDGPREATYGSPLLDFGRVSDAAMALDVDPAHGPLHHALYMILVKISRLVQTPGHHDSVVDIAGYARTYEKVLDEMALNKRNTFSEPTGLSNDDDFWSAMYEEAHKQTKVVDPPQEDMWHG